MTFDSTLTGQDAMLILVFREAAKLFSDHCLHNIAKGWPSLTVLAIGGPSLTLDGLGAIGECPVIILIRM